MIKFFIRHKGFLLFRRIIQTPNETKAFGKKEKLPLPFQTFCIFEQTFFKSRRFYEIQAHIVG